MSTNNINNDKKRSAGHTILPNAFTFIEVIIALAIASISVLALLRLHIGSIAMADSAEMNTQAVLLAEQKIAETLALDYPEVGTNAGSVENNGLTLKWQTEVTDLTVPELHDADVNRLRKVSVDVTLQALGRKHLQMSTYIADKKLP